MAARLASIIVLAAVAAAGPVRPVAAAGAERAVPRGSPPGVKNWSGWDLALDRGYLVLNYLTGCWRTEDPASSYERAVRYDQPADSLGLDDFLALPPAERDRRVKLAGRERAKAARFEAMVARLGDLFRQNMRPVDCPTGGLTALARAVGHLVAAVGLDPTHPEAWYDLAYLTGAVGDQERSRACLLAGLAALDAAESGAGSDAAGGAGKGLAAPRRALRARLQLDLAWLCRDGGLWAEGHEWLDRAARAVPGDQELRLIRGLLLAGEGRMAEAGAEAAALRGLKYRKTNRGYVASDVQERWIQAVAYLAGGQVDLALRALGRIDIELALPHASRYWNDVGLVLEMAGQPEAARAYYGLAAIHRPLFIYYPLAGYRGSEGALGQPGTGGPYTLAFDRFFVAGNRFAFGANAAAAALGEREPLARSWLARAAVNALGSCHRQGLWPGSALWLRALLLWRLGDVEATRRDLDLFSSAAAPDDGRAAAARELAQLWQAAGVAAIEAGSADAGRLALDWGVTLAPDMAAAWYNRGLLGFQQGRWEEAASDLARARALAPQQTQIAALARRAELAWQARAAGPSAPGPSAEVEDPAGGAGAPAYVAGPSLAARVGEASLGRSTAWTDNPYEDLLPALESAHSRAPSPETRHDLALALVRSGRHDQAASLLLPAWDGDLSPGERRLLLEVDRARGDPERARRLARTLRQGPPADPDPVLWSLVALTCLDSGAREEGLAALDAAIALDPANDALRRFRRQLAAAPAAGDVP